MTGMWITAVGWVLAAAACARASVFDFTDVTLSILKIEATAANPFVEVSVHDEALTNDLTFLVYPRHMDASEGGRFGMTDPSKNTSSIIMCCTGDDSSNNLNAMGYGCRQNILIAKSLLDDPKASAGYMLHTVTPSDARADMKGKSMFTQKLSTSIADEGLYVMRVVSCKAGQHLTPKVHKISVSLRSWFGYLPMSKQPVLWMIVVMMLFYLVVGIVWLVLSKLHWEKVLHVQHFLHAIIWIGFAESVLFVADYGFWNTQGWHSGFFIYTHALIVTAKALSTRMLFLAVAQGYGIVRLVLPHPTRIYIIAGVFVLSSLFSEIAHAYMDFNSNTDVSSWCDGSAFLCDFKEVSKWCDIPVLVCDFVIVSMSVSWLFDTMRTLWVRKLTMKPKLDMYKWTLVAFIIFVVGVFVCAILNVDTFQEEHWQIEWFADPLEHLVFLITLIIICKVWRPAKNNIHYTPVQNTGDVPDDADWDTSQDLTETAIKTGAYGDISRRNHKRTLPKANVNNTVDAENALKWVEDNVPDADITVASFVLEDHDLEEISKEISKMQ